MSDEITSEPAVPAAMPEVQPMPAAPEEKPLAKLAEAEAKIEQEASEPAAAADRLRAFEEKHLGADVVRIDGEIERGIGSKFSLMSDFDKSMHAALERLAAAEQRMLKATGELDEAKRELAAATDAVDAHGAE